MSDENSSNSDSDGVLDLSGLNFGPAWARDPSESKSLKKFKDRGDRDDRRGGDGRRDDRRGGGRRGDQRGGGGFRGQKGGERGRRGDDRRQVRQEVEPPEGISLSLMPAEESLDLLARRVIDSGQTYSVFDLAKVLLQSRDRFRVTFEASEKILFRCREDNSIWLSRDEALRHLWRGEWLKKYYHEVKVEGEAPKGNFSAVARCGLSNELLGPPNYHGYQEKLAALHRERFSNMPIDAYKAKVRMEHGEEAVEAWLESMKTVTKWKVAEPREEESGDENAEAGDSPVEGTNEEVGTPDAKAATETVAVVPVDDEAPRSESGEESSETPVATSEPDVEAGTEVAAVEEEGDDKEETVEGAVKEEAVEFFDDARAVERHFAESHFEEVFEKTERAWVTGDIRGNLLSPGLLTLLKRGVAEEKRYPAKLMPIVCRQLSGRNVAVFKWNKKLKVGPSRPHSVSSDVSLAERPRAIIDHLTTHSGVALKEFWEALMPDGVTAEQKHEWLQDFQWLLKEGHIILLADTTVHLAKKEKGPAQTPKSSKGPESKKAESAEETQPAVEQVKAEEKPAEQAETITGDVTSAPEDPSPSDPPASTEE